MATVKKKTSEGAIMKTTAKIPLDLWKEVKKVCVDQEMDLADAINQGLRMLMAQHQRGIPAKSKPA